MTPRHGFQVSDYFAYALFRLPKFAYAFFVSPTENHPSMVMFLFIENRNILSFLSFYHTSVTYSSRTPFNICIFHLLLKKATVVAKTSDNHIFSQWQLFNSFYQKFLTCLATHRTFFNSVTSEWICSCLRGGSRVVITWSGLFSTDR